MSRNFQGLPVCTSHNSLCDVTFDIPSMGTPAYSEPICQCPGKYSCEAAKKDPSRTITQEMISPGIKKNKHLSWKNGGHALFFSILSPCNAK